MQEAVLVLADGSVFKGISLGATGIKCGELVFNTSMAAYQEIITDPSYSGQIITFTYPHIGNTGINSLDKESEKIHCLGVVIRDLPNLYSSWRAEKSLSDYLKENNVLGIADIDTREITRRLRTHGSQNACLMAGEIDIDKALKMAKNPPKEDSVFEGAKKIAEYSGESFWDLKTNSYQKSQGDLKLLVYDFGIKNNQLRLLSYLGCKITILPKNTSASDALALNPDGIFLSNGAGNPEEFKKQIELSKIFIEKEIALFGHSLGGQILGLSAGAKSLKLKFGHHGSNHPILDLNSKKFFITSQNNGYVLDERDLPKNLIPTYKSLFDGSLMGFRLKDKPVFAFQGEPHLDDAKLIFSDFIKAMKEKRG